MGRSTVLLAAAALSLAVTSASADDPLPAPGQVEVKSYEVAGSGAPRIVARAVLDVPMKKLWAIVSDCAAYKGRLPRVIASELVE